MKKLSFKIFMLAITICLTTVCFTGCELFGGNSGGSSGGGSSTVYPTGISLDESTLTMTIGDTLSLAAAVEPTNANNKTVTWSSSNTSAATVSGGTIKAVGIGSTTITAKTSNDLTATCSVTVNDIDESLIHTIVQPETKSMEISQPLNLVHHTRSFILTTNGQEESFSYTAQAANGTPLTNGIFRVEASYGVYWRITDSSNNRILGNGTGFTVFSSTAENVTFSIGMQYTIRIQKSTSSGPCEIKVYAPNGTADITGNTEISDVLWFSSQERTFTYTPTVSGIFLISSSYSVYWRITDRHGNRLIGNGTGFSVTSTSSQNVAFTANEQYIIILQKSSSSGNYKLTIDQPNPVADITGKQKVYDNMRFSGQVNVYTFTPKTTGSYSLTASLNVYWRITDSFDNRLIGSGTGFTITSNSSQSVTLTAGEQYTIMLQKSSSNGSYTLEIKKPS